MTRYFFPLALSLCLVACAKVQTGAVSRATSESSAPVVPAVENSTAARLGDLVNSTRRAAGRRPIMHNALMDEIAMWHAKDMQSRGSLSHVDSLGRTPHGRLRSAGYRTCLSAENVAKGQPTAERFHQAMMRSSPHRKNLLRKDVGEFGVGYVPQGPYWVLLLARPGC